MRHFPFSRFSFSHDLSYLRNLIHLPAINIYDLHSLEQLSYAGIFFGVALSGYLLPVPEELILLGGGFLAAEHVLWLPLVIIMSIAGAMAGDNMLYYLASHGSHFAKKYHDRVAKTHAGWYLRHLRKQPFFTVFFSRFIIGMRALNPLISGLAGTRWKIFFTAGFLSAAVYVPLVVGIGWIFHTQISQLIMLAQSVREILLALFVVGCAVLIPLFITNLLESKK